jgi:alpha-tubulin suppressor-like RCC1 family protein
VGACKTSCANDSDCLPNYFCGAGSCHQAATAVVCGVSFTCAILYDGTVRCWGDNHRMQLGTGSASSTSLPVEVTGLPKPATALALGEGFACASLDDGSVWCWGDDLVGEVGNGMFSSTSGPVGYAPAKVKSLGSPVTAIAAGVFHVCAVVSKATVWCWGNNGNAELGSGMATTSAPGGINLPVQAKVDSGTIVAVAAGAEQSYALFSNDTLIQSWGGSESGQLGNGSTAVTTAIQDVGPGLAAVSVTSGTYAYFACAIGTDGAVYCWGDGSDGALGSSSPVANQSNPVKIGGLPATANQISASRETVCAILRNGTLYCWGGNEDGEAGRASPSNFPTPMQVTGFTGTPVSVAVGYTHTCALMNNGAVWCWGADDAGQLGDGRIVSSPTPIQVNSW